MLFAESFPIKGWVFEYYTNNPIEGVNVYLLDTSLGTTTEEDGSFIFYAPPGRYDIIASFIGFIKYKKEIFISSEKQPMNLLIFLEQEILEGEKIKVEAEAIGGEIAQLSIH